MAGTVAKAAKTYTQYSKKLAGWITLFWCVYRVLALAAAVIRPEIADHMTPLTAGVDDVMICNVFAYNGNSLGERALYAILRAKTAPRAVKPRPKTAI